MALDLERLLQPISDASPCGDDLVYDAAFLELDQLFKGSQTHGIVEEAEHEEPNWREVRTKALEVCERTRDLRVLVMLTVCEMLTDGARGLRDGLRLLDATLDRYWDDVHPKLDPDDDNDPTERVNIVSALAMPLGSMGDPVRFRDRLNDMVLLDAGRMGSITLRDVRIDQDPSLGGTEESSDQVRAKIAGVVGESDAEVINAAFECIGQTASAAQAVDQTLTQQAGSGSAASFDDVHTDLRVAVKAAQGWMDLRGLGEGGSDEDGAGVEGEAGGGSGGGGSAPSAPGEIRSRQDVELALQRIRQYYERTEPSSPVPLLLGVAESMISKSFLEITEAMPPDATGTVVRIRDAAHGGGAG
ncbi:MAG: type VI secretion system protein TssA [Planctomycetota bacterium]